MKNKKIDTKYILMIIGVIALIADVICIRFSFWKTDFFCIRLLALLISTNIFLKQLTNNDKVVSKWGTIIIGLSSAVLSGISFDLITFGEIFIIFLNKVTDSEVSKTESEKDKKVKKILYILGMIISAFAYLFKFDLSLEISFGYVFLALAIWVLIKNRKKYKLNLKNVFITIGIVAFIAIVSILVEVNTGLFSQARDICKNNRIGNGLTYNFSYIYNFLLPYKDTGMNSNLASMISVFPVPVILALVYLYKKEKHEEFLFPMICVITIEFVWSMISLPNIIGNITGLSLVSIKDATLGVALANVYMFLYMYSNVEEQAVSFTAAIRLTLLILVMNFFVRLPNAYSDKIYNYIFAIVLTLESFLMLCYTDKKYKKVSLWVMGLLTIIGLPIVFL